MGGQAKAARAADKKQSQIEKQKLLLQQQVDKFENDIYEKQAPLREGALNSFYNSLRSKDNIGKTEVEKAKATTGVLSGYAKNLEAEDSIRTKGLFDAMKNPIFSVNPSDIDRISNRMAQLQSFFGETKYGI